jgi:hypothetical protein
MIAKKSLCNKETLATGDSAERLFVVTNAYLDGKREQNDAQNAVLAIEDQISRERSFLLFTVFLPH